MDKALKILKILLLILILVTAGYYVARSEDNYNNQLVVNANLESQIHAINEKLLKAQEEGVISAQGLDAAKQGLDAANIKISELTAAIEELKIKKGKK